MRLLSIVLPVYNEEELLPLLRGRLTTVVENIRSERGLAVEIVFVDDGSQDVTPVFLEAWASEDPRVKVVTLSRNFGHQAALTAGLDVARGDTVILMDSDLQDPPEVIPLLLDKQQEGYDVVYGRRGERKGEGIWKRGTAWLFYRVMKRLVHRELPADTGDFRLISGKALQALAGMKERHRFLRGLSVWVGFRQSEVTYSRDRRAAGETKYSTPKMLRLAWNAAVSFSTLPLTLATLWGTGVSLFGLAYLIYTVYRYFVFQDTVPGWATLVVLLCLIGGSILVSLGIIGSYIGKIFEEVKSRPIYLVKKTQNLTTEIEIDRHRPEERVDVSRRVGVNNSA